MAKPMPWPARRSRFLNPEASRTRCVHSSSPHDVIRSQLMIDHKDGNEANGRKSNLRWLCRSCNTREGAKMAKKGKGRRTVQYNPGAATLGEYLNAVLQHTRGAHDEGGRTIHETSKSKRADYASEIWARRKSHGNPSTNYRGATIEDLGEFKGFRVTIPKSVARDRRVKTFETYSLPMAKQKIDAEFGRANPLRQWTPAKLNGVRVRVRAVGRKVVIDLGKVGRR